MYDSRVPGLYVTKCAAQKFSSYQAESITVVHRTKHCICYREALVVSDYLLHHIKLLEHYSNSSFITTVRVSFKTMLLL